MTYNPFSIQKYQDYYLFKQTISSYRVTLRQHIVEGTELIDVFHSMIKQITRSMSMMWRLPVIP